MRLVVDANLSPRVAERLRGAGHDVVHVFEIGLVEASDEAILQAALTDDRVVVSSDTDFGTLLARYEASKPSFVLLRHANEMTPDQHADLLIANLSRVSDALNAGAILSLARGRARVRRLPIGSED